jgi:superfamily II DNA/RNA helicase
VPSPTRRPRPASSSRPYRGQSRQSRSAPVSDTSAIELERAFAAAAALPAAEATTFAALGLTGPLVEAMNRRGITTPFAIQTRTIPDALAGRDVLGRAQTGSGKTLAFGLPMLARLAAGDRRNVAGQPRALVLVPTRELAKQVTDALSPLAQSIGVRVTSVYGGAPMGRQVDQLRRGVDVVVATPGRLIDHLERGTCTLSAIEVTVLDEADYMADLGFLPAVTQLLDLTPAGAQRMLFSATLDRGVAKLCKLYLTDPAVHAVSDDMSKVEAMEHHVFTLRGDDKVAIATEVAARPGRTLFFVRTKHGADRLAKQMRTGGVDAAAIHGNLTQSARQRALDGFAAGSTRVLVATDVAARGIHVDDVDLVIHYDPAGDHKDYLHRSGRTARAGSSGTVVSFVQPEQTRDVARMHELAKVSAVTTRVAPGHEAVRELATSGTPFEAPPARTYATERPAATRKPFRGGSDRDRAQSGSRSGSPRGRGSAHHRSSSQAPRG